MIDERAIQAADNRATILLVLSRELALMAAGQRYDPTAIRSCEAWLRENMPIKVVR